jgi:hypothetical protein
MRKTMWLPVMSALAVGAVLLTTNAASGQSKPAPTRNTAASGTSSEQSAPSRAGTAATDRKTQQPLAPPPLQPGEVRYLPEGVDTFPAPSGAKPAVSTATTVETFKALAPVVGHFSAVTATSTPNVRLVTVTDTQPLDEATETGTTAPETYLGWLVVYTGTTPVLYGGIHAGTAPDSSSFNCDLVGIRNATTGQWSKVFQSCSGSK